MSSVNRPSDGKAWPSVGMKCVCIKDVRNAVTLKHPHPAKGQVYTVRKVVTDSSRGILAILLEEISMSEWSVPSRLEPGFNINGFRPLVSKTQAVDLAMFKTIANEAEKPLTSLLDALSRAELRNEPD